MKGDGRPGRIPDGPLPVELARSDARVDRNLHAIGEAAAKLRTCGLGWQEIGERLGVTKAYAFNSCHSVLQREAATRRESLPAALALEQRRLDALLSSIYERALSGEVEAIDRALKIAERRARLLGLDAPQRTELTALVAQAATASTEEILRELAHRHGYELVPLPTEASDASDGDGGDL